MKFLADENFPAPSVSLLREAGHDVEQVGLVAAGASDVEVVAMANGSLRTVLTFDSDLGTLAVAANQPVRNGIVYFRLAQYKPETPEKMLLDYLAANPGIDLSMRITVFDPPRVRQRKI